MMFNIRAFCNKKVTNRTCMAIYIQFCIFLTVIGYLLFNVQIEGEEVNDSGW